MGASAAAPTVISGVPILALSSSACGASARGEICCIRGVLELHRQCLFQRAIENRITSGVDEISEQDGVFFRQCSRTTGVEKATDSGYRHHYCRRRDVPLLPAHGCRNCRR